MKQAIITGATGFIGSYFVEFLSKKGIDVIALGRKKYKDISIIRRKRIKDSKYIRIDMSNINLLKKELKKNKLNIDNNCVFINLAWAGKNKLSDLEVKYQMMNVVWSVNAFKIANEIKCKKFIQIGTMEEAFTKKYLSLDHHKNKEYNRHLIYSVAKIISKKALKLLAKESGTKLIYVFHSHVMAPDDDKDSFLQVTLNKLINNSDLIFSTCEQTFDVISEEDCANGYYLICKKGIADKEYWVGSGDPRPLKDYVKRMYKLFPSGKKMQFGKFKYNDVKLQKVDFSIKELVKDTGFKPKYTYEEIVNRLYDSLIIKKK